MNIHFKMIQFIVSIPKAIYTWNDQVIIKNEYSIPPPCAKIINNLINIFFTSHAKESRNYHNSFEHLSCFLVIFPKIICRQVIKLGKYIF